MIARALLLASACCTASAALAQAVPAATVDVPVLAHDVAKGVVVTAGDFVMAPRPAGEARFVLSAEQAAGKEAVRPLQAGNPLRPADLIRAQWVHRGDPVTISLKNGALSISAQGKALAGGAEGEAVRVVNLATNRTLDAMVEAPGVVRIIAP